MKPVGWVYIDRGYAWVRAAAVLRVEMIVASMRHWELLGYPTTFSIY